MIIDSDQHLYESRTLWADHIDPAHRDDALAIVDDELGHAWLRWHDRALVAADVQDPGETDAIGERRRREREGLPPIVHYDDALPDDYWNPIGRLAKLDDLGLDEAVLFPNYGLIWERRLGRWSVPALLANMAAWNRWCASVTADGKGRLHPVAHLDLRDAGWVDAQLASLGAAGVRLAMIAPALIDDRPLSAPEHDRIWSAFVEHGITPVFHVADQPRPFADAWYPDDADDSDDDDSFGPSVLESVFLYSAAALAVTDLIVNGTLERHPDLRLGIVELSSVWVPLYLMMLDGGWDFTSRLNGGARVPLGQRPSEYFRRQIRVSSFAYELPGRLTEQAGDLFMCCSDYPHSEGTADPLRDYRAPTRYGVDPESSPALFGDNAAFLLRQ